MSSKHLNSLLRLSFEQNPRKSPNEFIPVEVFRRKCGSNSPSEPSTCHARSLRCSYRYLSGFTLFHSLLLQFEPILAPNRIRACQSVSGSGDKVLRLSLKHHRSHHSHQKISQRMSASFEKIVFQVQVTNGQ